MTCVGYICFHLLTSTKVDAVVTNSINAHGFFAKAGPLAIFTSAHVSVFDKKEDRSNVGFSVLLTDHLVVYSQDLRL